MPKCIFCKSWPVNIGEDMCDQCCDEGRNQMPEKKAKRKTVKAFAPCRAAATLSKKPYRCVRNANHRGAHRANVLSMATPDPTAGVFDLRTIVLSWY